MRLRTCSVALFSLLVLLSQPLAADGQKKGFILGGGIGAGSLRDKMSWGYPEYTHWQGHFAVETNLKIGYAPSNSLEVYWINSGSWFGYSQAKFLIGLSGLGLTKYLNSKGTGFFVSGGIGLSFYKDFDPEFPSATGLGLLGGIGCDIAKHWSIQGDVLYTTMNGRGAFSITSLGVRATVNYLAF
jgi:hypothetical protein